MADAAAPETSQPVLAAKVSNADVLASVRKHARRRLVVRKERATAPEAPRESQQLAQQEVGAAGLPWAIPGRLLMPSQELAELYEMVEYSSELGQNIAAMTTNIAGFGGRIKSRIDLDDPEVAAKVDKATVVEVQDEEVRLTNLFLGGILGGNAGGFSARWTFRELHTRTIDTRERTGNAYWEILPSALPRFDGQGNPLPADRVGLRYLSSTNVFATERDKEPTEASIPTPCVYRDTAGCLRRGIRMEPVVVHFRRYVMRIGGQSVWFKELGDPRRIDSADGRVLADGEEPRGKEANELFHWCLGKDTSVYGSVRWMGNLLNLHGERSSEEVNFDTLDNNAVPAMLAMVSGSNVRLSDATMDAIEEFENAENRNRARWLVLEAEPVDSGGMGLESGAAKLDVRPLTDAQRDDAMFGKYQKTIADKVQSSFRHSEIFIGRNTTAGRSAIDPARRLSDEQVYKPERDDFDEKFNLQILPFFGIKHHYWASGGPNTTDDQDMIKVMQAAEHTGGMTPQISRDITGEILNRDLGKVTNIDPHTPLNLQLADKLSGMRNTEVNLGPKAPQAKGMVRLAKETAPWEEPAISAQEIRDIVREELAAAVAALAERR